MERYNVEETKILWTHSEMDLEESYHSWKGEWEERTRKAPSIVV